MSIVIKSNPPECSEGNFEKLLATDDLFLDCFNKFLSLETFSKRIRFNVNNFTFEIVSSKRERLIQQIREEVLAEHFSQTRQKPADFPDEINVAYTVKVLIGSKAISWIKANRLRYFLQSEYYMKYRIGRLLSQITSTTDMSKIVFDHSTPMLQERAESKKSYKSSEVEEERNISPPTEDRTSIIDEETDENPNIGFIAFNPLTNDKLMRRSVGLSRSLRVETPEIVEPDQTGEISIEQNDPPSERIITPSISPILQVKLGRKKIEEKDPFEDIDQIIFKENQPQPAEPINTITSYERLQNFENFLKNNDSDRFMAFWLEIDRLKIIQEQLQFPQSIQDAFTRPTSSMSFSPQHLSEINIPFKWNGEKISLLQSKIIEPLLVYWMPMFLRQHFLVTEYYVGSLCKNIVQLERELIKPYKVYFDVDLAKRKCLNPKDGKLLRCMRQEKVSGYVFYEHIIAAQNCHLQNCYKVWNLVKDYQNLFELESFDVSLSQKYSNYIYANYLHSAAPNFVNLPRKIADEIYARLSDPPKNIFEDLEFYVLSELRPIYESFRNSDNSSLKKVPQKTTSVKLETKSRAVNEFVSRGRIKQEVLFPFDPMRDYTEPVFQSEIKVGTSRKAKTTISSLMADGTEIEKFKDFLKENGALIDFECWQDVESFKKTSHLDKASCDIKLIEIKGRYLNNKYFFGENSPATEREQNKAMNLCGGWSKLLNDIPPARIVTIMQSHVSNRLNNKWIPAYLQNQSGEGVPVDLAEKAEEQMKEEEIAELVPPKVAERNSIQEVKIKTEPSATEILDFRSSMKNPHSYDSFCAYLRTKGPNAEANLRFWEEIQKYKQLFLSKCDDALKRNKINSILSCFLNSQIPPQIQISVSKSIAEKIIDSGSDINPYLFREAHFTVFRWLLTNWAEFVEFRKNTKTYTESTRKDVTEPVKSAKETKQPVKIAQMHGNKIEWSYSNYLDALDVEMMVDERRDKGKRKHN